MPIHIIPVEKLSAEALDGVIKEFISRNGTDYGEFEAAMETKVRQVKQKLEKGLAVLIYDDEAETTNIFRHDDPILKRLSVQLKHHFDSINPALLYIYRDFSFS